MTASLGTVVKYWKPIAGGVLALFVAVGFDFHTPAWHFQQVAAETQSLHRTDSTFDERLSKIEADHQDIERYLKALSTAQCIDRPRRETQLMGLDCSKLLHEGDGR